MVTIIEFYIWAHATVSYPYYEYIISMVTPRVHNVRRVSNSTIQA